MHRTVVRLGVLLLALSAVSLAVGTGASFLSGTADPVDEEVSLSPASGPNGDYAYLTDGELVVDLTPANPNLNGDGLGADSVTTLDGVFVVHYGGERFARVWLTHDSDSVTLRADGRPIQSEPEAIVLEANESQSVGLRVDTTGSADGLLENITVHARVAEPGDELVGTDTETTAPNSDREGRSIRSFAPDAETRTFTVTNAPAGSPITLDTDRLVVDRVEDRTLTLDELVVTTDTGAGSVDVRVMDRNEVDAGPGVSPLGALEVTDGGTVTRATFRFSAATAYLERRNALLDRLVVRRNGGTGWQSLGIDRVGMRNGRAVFEADSPGFSRFVVGLRTPAIRVSDASLDRTTATPGESVPVVVSVTNDGLATGERTVRVTVDGDRVASRSVSLAPGESTTVRLVVTADSPGRYAVGVDGDEVGTVVVSEPTATGSAAPAATASPVDDATGTPAPDVATPPTSTPVGEVGGFRIPAAAVGSLLIVLVVALLAIRRHDGGQE